MGNLVVLAIGWPVRNQLSGLRLHRPGTKHDVVRAYILLPLSKIFIRGSYDCEMTYLARGSFELFKINVWSL